MGTRRVGLTRAAALLVFATAACSCAARSTDSATPARPPAVATAASLATPTTPVAIPVESGCAQEGTIRSPGSYDAATITLDNQTNQDLKVYWLDFNGARTFYSDLKAGVRYNQPTWIGHVSVVADQSGKCVRLQSANAVSQELVISN